MSSKLFLKWAYVKLINSSTSSIKSQREVSETFLILEFVKWTMHPPYYEGGTSESGASSKFTILSSPEFGTRLSSLNTSLPGWYRNSSLPCNTSLWWRKTCHLNDENLVCLLGQHLIPQSTWKLALWEWTEPMCLITCLIILQAKS